ncbi:MAG: FUSC family protein, partial [Chitinophagaceae bacterium]|nr:FUSC family protein [Chitinophagaceae bacterium]
MDYLKQYRSFISSHYLSDGVRITAAILTPVLVFGYFGMLTVGLTVALGALSVSITDAPGPIQHRRNGLMICSLLVFVMALLAGFAEPYPWLFALLLPLMCFVFSIIGVYGARATGVGLASLIAFVIQTQRRFVGMEVVYNALYILAGGCWYLVLSSLLYSLRPYRIIQQALGDYVMSVAAYLRAKASFYDTGFSYEKDYADILSVQVKVQSQQALVAELLFKTQSVVKESTFIGRVLMMVFLDVADLFEIVMTSHQDYEKLHGYFDETGILEEYRQLINTLAEELDQVGIALKSGRRSDHDEKVDEEISAEREHLKTLRAKKLDPANLEGFISLRHILDSIDELSTRIRSLHQYTGYDKKLRKKKIETPDPETFISHQPLDPQLVFDNLSLRSNIFRHSLRIAAAALFAYIISWFLPLGHGYWILLTVIVILKPGYGLTRTRNLERLGGTIIGALLGALVLYLVRDRTAIVVILALSMLGAYSFMRKTYFISVILMTLYILLMFYLLDPHDFKTILTDRIIDTAI